jgi:hypothetical protein
MHPTFPAALRRARTRVLPPVLTRILTLATAAALPVALLATAVPLSRADAAGGVTLDRRIRSAAVTESSGLARSTYDRPVLWTHNDSGGNARVYAVGSDGSVTAVVTLGGATLRDWEDMASGPDHQLYVADIGDNSTSRSHISVYRFTEPHTLGNTTVATTQFDFSYPDGKHNAEALLVHPSTGRIYVVTKSTGGGAIYSAPSSPSRTSVNRLTKVASAPVKITAGAFTPDGSRFVLCNYSKAFVYRSFGGAATQLDKPSLEQGESLEVNQAGTAVFMGSEGSSSPIYKVPLAGY